MIVRRGGKSGDVFGCACRDHGEGRGCSNRSSVPYREAHEAVIGALRRTFSPESFEAHLARLAQDVDARDRRSAERDHLLAEIPKLAAAETKLAKLVAVTDDVEALVAQLKALQTERKAAEARVGELEGIELNLRADQAQVAALQATGASGPSSWVPMRPTCPTARTARPSRAASAVRSWCGPSRCG